MKRADYQEFYKIVIEPCIEGIKALAQKEMGNDSVIRVNNNTNKLIFRHYQLKRDFIVSNYMKKSTPVALDRHKVASCMVYAILKSNPIKVNKWHKNLPEKLLLANEYLAFYVALNIIEMYKLDEMKDAKIEELGDKWKEEMALDLSYQILEPRTSHEDQFPDNTFESNLCKALCYVRIDNIKKYDVLAYAHIFFLLEKYTDICELMKKKA